MWSVYSTAVYTGIVGTCKSSLVPFKKEINIYMKRFLICPKCNNAAKRLKCDSYMYYTAIKTHPVIYRKLLIIDE